MTDDPKFYSSIDAVITRTGVSAEDLGFEFVEFEESGSGEEESGEPPYDAFGAFIEALLTEVTDLMDRHMRKSYLSETIPAGLNGIAADAAADSLREMVATRQTPVVRVDDFAVRVIQSRVLSNDIRDRLELYGKGRGAVSVDLDQDSLGGIPTTFNAYDLDGEFFL